MFFDSKDSIRIESLITATVTVGEWRKYGGQINKREIEM